MSEQELANENVLVTNEKANELITEEYVNAIYEFEDAKAKLEVLDSKIRNELLKVMTDNNVFEIDNDKWNVKLICPKPSKVVDTEKLKREGLYDLYSKDKNVHPYVKVALKYED